MLFFRSKPSLARDLNQAWELIKKLFKLRLVKIVLFTLVFILLAPFVVFFILRPSPSNQISYGTNFSDKYAEQMGLNWQEVYLAILDDLQVKNIRLVAYWDDIEPIDDQYDFSKIKWQLEEAQKRDVNVILAIGRKVPRYPECFEPQWWKDTDDEELRNLALYEYIKEGVSQLKSYETIKYWQVENEPFWPFGVCGKPFRRDVIQKEIKIVRSMDDRPIIVQDSGEGGLWKSTYELGDYLAISMYRKIWYDFWGVFFGRFIYFQYPLAHWSYKIKADVVGVPYENIIVTELQAEPWGPVINSELSDEERDKTMSRNDFIETLSYAQRAGFKDLYLWGAEWWYFEKYVQGNSFYWDTAKALFLKY